MTEIFLVFSSFVHTIWQNWKKLTFLNWHFFRGIVLGFKMILRKIGHYIGSAYFVCTWWTIWLRSLKAMMAIIHHPNPNKRKTQKKNSLRYSYIVKVIRVQLGWVLNYPADSVHLVKLLGAVFTWQLWLLRWRQNSCQIVMKWKYIWFPTGCLKVKCFLEKKNYKQYCPILYIPCILP